MPETITAPGPLSATTLEAHLRAMLPQVEVVPIARLRDDLSVGCVDGRRGSCAASVPGGNAGLFILLLAAIEQHSRRELGPRDVDDLLGDYLDAFGTFYLHSDEAATNRLATYLQQSDAAAVNRLLSRGPLDDHVIETMILPEHIGCGHIQRMLLVPEAYGLRRELVESALRAVFKRLSDDRIEYDVLGGAHAEEAVVRVRAASPEGTPLPVATVCPHFGGTDVFVYHPDAAAYLGAAHGLFLVETGRISSAAVQRFIEIQHGLADKQLGATLDALAPDLPTFDVTVRIENGDAPELTVSEI